MSGDPKGFAMSGVEAALARLSEAGYDSGAAQAEVTEAAREPADSLNVPSWWREATARFDAVEGAPPAPKPKGRA